MICLLAALMVAFSFEDACGSYAAFAEAKEVQPAVSENEAGGENAGPQTDLEEDAADANSEGDAAEEDTAKAGADPGIGEGSPEDAEDADSAEEIADEAMSEALPRKAAAKAPAAAWTGSDPISTVELFEGMGIASQFAVFANEFKNSNHMEGNIAVKKLTGSTSQVGVSDRVKSDITAWRATFHKEVKGTAKPKDFTFGVFKKSGNDYILVESTTIRTDASGNASGSLEGTFSNAKSDEYYLFEMDKNGKPIIGSQQEVEVKSGIYDVTYDETYNRLNNAQPLIATNNTSYIETVAGNISDYQNVDFYNHNGNDARGANLVIGSGNPVTKLTNGGEYLINDRLKINAAVAYEQVKAGTPFPIDFDTEMANLKTLSARLANAVTTDEIEVINVTANTNNKNFSSSLRDAVAPDYFAGTNFAADQGLADDSYLKDYANGKYVVINIDCTGLNDYEVSHIKVPSEVSNLHPKDVFLQPEAGHIIYNFVKKSGNTYVPYTGHVMVKETTGTVLAPAATVTCHATISGSVYANKISHDGGEIHKKTIGAEVARGEVRVVNTKVGPEEEPADAEAEITATKTVTADGQKLEGALKGNDFWFILSPMSFVSPEGQERTDGIPMPTEGLQSDGTAMAANQADGTISFGKIKYSEEGVYTYSLREWLPEGVDETNPSLDGVKYDLNTYYVRVVVVKEGNALKATTEYYRSLPELQMAEGWQDYTGATKTVDLRWYYKQWDKAFNQTVPQDVLYEYGDYFFSHLTEYGPETETTTDIDGNTVSRYWIYKNGTTEYLIDKGNYKQWIWKVWEERATWTSGDPLEAAPEFINEYRVVEMPETGSLGRLNCYLLGGLLVLAGMLILRRREDSQRI